MLQSLKNCQSRVPGRQRQQPMVGGQPLGVVGLGKEIADGVEVLFIQPVVAVADIGEEIQVLPVVVAGEEEEDEATNLDVTETSTGTNRGFLLQEGMTIPPHEGVVEVVDARDLDPGHAVHLGEDDMIDIFFHLERHVYLLYDRLFSEDTVRNSTN